MAPQSPLCLILHNPQSHFISSLVFVHCWASDFYPEFPQGNVCVDQTMYYSHTSSATTLIPLTHAQTLAISCELQEAHIMEKTIVHPRLFPSPVCKILPWHNGAMVSKSLFCVIQREKNEEKYSSEMLDCCRIFHNHFLLWALPYLCIS